MLNIIESKGSENSIRVPVLSHTMNPQNKQKKQELGEFEFRECVFSFEDWTWVMLELKRFHIPFYGSSVVNFNSDDVEVNPHRFSIAVQSYHSARLWIQQTVDAIIQRELSGYAQTVRFKNDGTPESEPSEELQIKAFELFSKARSEHVNIMVDGNKIKKTTHLLSDKDANRLKDLMDQQKQKKINVKRISNKPKSNGLPVKSYTGGENPL